MYRCPRQLSIFSSFSQSDREILRKLIGPKVKARREFVDRNKVLRKAGEEWLVHTEGTYLPGNDYQ